MTATERVWEVPGGGAADADGVVEADGVGEEDADTDGDAETDDDAEMDRDAEADGVTETVCVTAAAGAARDGLWWNAAGTIRMAAAATTSPPAAHKAVTGRKRVRFPVSGGGGPGGRMAGGDGRCEVAVGG